MGDFLRAENAAGRGYLPAADRVLRGNPAVVRLRGAGGSTPLMFAALYGDAGLVKQLLAAGADPNMANAAGATALAGMRGVEVLERSDGTRMALFVDEWRAKVTARDNPDVMLEALPAGGS